MGSDAPLLYQQLNLRLALEYSLWTAAQVHLAVTLYVDDTLRELGNFSFVAADLFSAGRRHTVAVSDLLRLTERLEDLQTEAQGMITNPHLSMTLIFIFSCLRSQ